MKKKTYDCTTVGWTLASAKLAAGIRSHWACLPTHGLVALIREMHKVGIVSNATSVTATVTVLAINSTL